MDAFLHIVGLLTLFAVCLVALATLVVGLPGTFIIVVAALGYGWLTSFTAVTWTTIFWLLGLALAGEGLELLSSMLGSEGSRPTRRVATLALVGGIVGGIIGTPLLFGIGSLLGALAGAFTGAALASSTEGARPGAAMRSGLAAMRGRFLGFIAKLAIAVAMLVVLFAAAL